ncbi:TraI DNA relaxase [Rhodococcus sp. 05-2254-5]|uniref:TraI DNA relaxase n=1 Tax=unclassified Rhodococcus (in: high G+C Gram-positive bacteria) TaxID=192944 RepID=UPI000B9B2FC7|nr:MULTISPECIES: TraI DNA relaxase [unclassified Rhodococcus (in: high G+C Gram-positive bacteria)]OZE28470.1 TraI DNA relaxase [Rhodococcus sp. 05-2254-5]OZE38175.1 TraI DNA relaxase [Rhodococcus sp. 05-2254-6]OZE57035.1 TraI DNA relaxase [Rhodococcus sp. 05-2254-1]OZE72340.1 TraI DNA relaxase [Rhodococcus sp. 15-649-2-2]
MTRTVSTAEQQRRSQIAAAAYERGRRATLAAARRRSLPDRAHTRRDEIRSRSHSYEPRSDSRAFGLLDTDVSLVRAAAYLAASGVAHELIAAQTFTDPAQQEWADATVNRTAVHEDAWRERLIDNGIDDAVLRPGLSLDVLELPAELDGLDFEDIAEHTLDVSSTSADVEPLRLVDLLRETPRQEQSSGSVVDITDRVARIIEIDRGIDAAVEGGVDAW